jgi:ADP-ribose pyrophosphatase
LELELLELPAGTRDVHEERPQDAAARELAEEVGLEAARLELIGHFYSTPGFCDEELWCFLARDLSAVSASRQGPEEEHMTLERHPFASVGEMVQSGLIKDAKTIVCLFMAQFALSS